MNSNPASFLVSAQDLVTGESLIGQVSILWPNQGRRRKFPAKGPPERLLPLPKETQTSCVYHKVGLYAVRRGTLSKEIGSSWGTGIDAEVPPKSILLVVSDRNQVKLALSEKEAFS